MPDNISDWEIRSDQLHLYRMVRAVDSGICDANLASLKPGPINLSRWNTMACRLLRLYVTKPSPSNNLKTLVNYVMKVYVPFWFRVKSKPQAIHGSRHIFQFIQWTQTFPESVKKIVHRSIQINGFFCHPENILLAMLTDENKQIRIDAIAKILEARRRPPSTIRQFIIPKINFNADSYTTMINWNEVENICEPPCIQFYTQSYLQEFVESDEIIEIPGKIKLHKQNYSKNGATICFVKLYFRFPLPYAKHRALRS